MKVKKKWKRYVHQITLACLLICSIVSFFPDNVFADGSPDHPKFKRYFSKTYGIDGKGNFQYNYTFKNFNGKSTVFQFRVFDSSSGKLVEVMYVSASSFTYDVDAYDTEDGKTGHGTGESSGCTYETINGETKPVYFFDNFYYCSSSDISVSGACYDITNKTGYMYSIARFLYEDEQIPEEITCSSEGGEGDEGGIDNPILDSDIGCPIITRKISRDLSGVDSGNSGAGGSLHVGETQVGDNIYYDNGGLENGGNGFYTSFTWKNSTTTGFSLNKNKYAQTFLQVRIQNRSVIYSNLKHTKVKRKLDSYGENSLVYDSWAVSKKPLYFNLSSKTFLKKYLPKYYDEINSPVNLTNVLFLGNKYAFQFRIICTDDLSVIPGSGGNSKWHCGRWTEVTVNCDVLEDDDPYQKTGDIDSNGDFIQKEDDTTTKIDDSSSGQADNMDDFKDSAENGTKKGLDTSGFGWDDFKNLINECKQVPGLIKSVFSFLPDWVLVFVALAFGIWLFVLIKRAIV